MENLKNGKMIIEDEYSKMYKKNVDKIGKKYSGNTITDSHFDLLREMVSKFRPEFSKFITDDKIEEKIYDQFHEIIEHCIEESYKLGFHFAKYQLLKHLEQTEYDDF